MNNDTIFQIKNLKKTYAIKKGLFAKNVHINAVNDVSFEVKRGEILSIVGESGCYTIRRICCGSYYCLPS